MASAAKSLRSMVEDWLAPTSMDMVHVIEFKNQRATRQCYVCVEARRAAGTAAMFFFHHKDGLWCVFPPSRERPTMRVA
ncbi:hypothetical protein SAMN05446935_4969 [Burkholderia sp. YR290]|uniref:hypothetical protein n=1 Tax=Paraburkholderia hospita TaxID=169430 RepID=UPI0002719C34|nr:hypothetical protein [Paraburkholderia hospita]EUC18654.1 hypothetical protein PMI06_003279 [Burkholderia sp. BT03]SKC59652.1 hypothetical protein SAMN06266956_1053 [Paraburkholderia hospita]SKC85387.1 hypothetical protein SAMN05446934_3892 [Paraburkholderia hospita]SOE84527.1 hypothetical protein SAMN05446935_4969 [Burkholderia sp. YR290]